jgi:very-short-patch-repair endonuclease
LEVERDREREVWLSTQGFTTLRFWNNDVMQNLTGVTGVLEVIRENILRI